MNPVVERVFLRDMFIYTLVCVFVGGVGSLNIIIDNSMVRRFKNCLSVRQSRREFIQFKVDELLFSPISSYMSIYPSSGQSM